MNNFPTSETTITVKDFVFCDKKNCLNYDKFSKLFIVMKAGSREEGKTKVRHQTESLYLEL